MNPKQKKVQHLYARAAFGAHPFEVRQQQSKSIPALVKELMDDSAAIRPLDQVKDPTRNSSKKVSDFKLGLLFLRSRRELSKLNLTWLERMAKGPGRLREKMTFFWHDHFATHTPIAYLMQKQNNLLREHALGSFRQMLHGIARDPAMLIYLNNQQNKKGHPNENFAREVMELFTLGEGNYTEQDIKEAARAFTGWTVNRQGEYEFIEKEHDFGEKTVLGKTAPFSGEEIIDLLLEQRQTAVYITGKILRFFVNENPPAAKVEEFADIFYQSDYDIGELMVRLFVSNWFYEAQNIGCLVKSPVELFVYYMRLLQLEMRMDRLILTGQRALGQVLFFPPNVSGWPSGAQWVDSSSLIVRMKLPLLILGLDEYEIEVKPEFEAMGTDASENKIPKIFKAKVSWKDMLKVFNPKPDKDLVDAILDSVLQCPTYAIDRENLLSFADRSDKFSTIKTLIIRTMALPEFQMI